MSLKDGIRRRAAPLLVLAGAGLASLVLVPRVPHERGVGLRLPDAGSVTGLDVAWAPAPRADGAGVATASGEEPVQGGSWHFASGAAPATVETRVHLPDGRYELNVTIERGSSREAFRKVITLGDADHILVPLR